MAMPRFNLGGALIEGLQAGQADAMRRQQMRLAEEQAAFDRSLRPIRQAEAQYGLRGQILGPVETPEDYAAALGEVHRLGLPTGDLPEDRRSTAWMTFKAPEAAPRIAPSWMPSGWDLTQTLENRIDLPKAAPSLPAGNMNEPGIAPEQIATVVQRRAQAGLPLQTQQKFQDADLGRQIQREELAKRSEKYRTQIDYADRAADLADKRFGLQETRDERQARLEREKLAMEREKLGFQRESAQREAAKPALNEGQAKAVLFGQEVAASLVDFEDLLGKGFDPTGAMGTADVAFANLGFGSDDAKIWTNASDQLAQAALRFESGAAIGEQEFGKKIRANVPKFGDSPAVVRRKLDAIRRAKTAFEAYTGKTFSSTAAGNAAPSSGLPTVSSQAAYDALPPGAKYKGPDGRIFTKKAQ